VSAADTRIRSLETARDCALLGAKQRTIAWLTGLPPNFILRTVFDEKHPAPIGPAPTTIEFYYRLTLQSQGEASAFAVKYTKVRQAGFTPADSLLTAYRRYLLLATSHAFCFDKAFCLVAHLEGRWFCASPTMQLVACPRCGAKHVGPIGSTPSNACPFCKILRFADGARDHGQASANHVHAPGHAPRRPSFSDELPLRISALRHRRALELLGAHPRVVRAIMATLPASFMFPPPEPARALVSVRRPLSLHRWGEAIKTSDRAQYALAAIAYRRLSQGGFDAPAALAEAYRHLRTLVPCELVPFDRVFEVISLLDARWGVSEPELRLEACDKCFVEQLVCRIDRQPAPCPFCSMRRFPSWYFRGQEAATTEAPT
jgi:Flagellar transcriptional activator (FlhC)